jgi:competence protein ComEC
MSTRVLFHKVGHGQAVHVFTPDGKVVVIDLGCSADFSPLTWLKEKSKRTTIDMLVITHPHGDHIDEIELVDKLGFTVRQIWRPTWLTPEEIYAANQAEYRAKVETYLQLSARFTFAIPETDRVGNPTCTGGASIAVYNSQDCGHSNINNHSLVSVVQYASGTVVVPGDNESPSWGELLKNPQFCTALQDVDVFLASHHGRESGYCGEVFADGRKPWLFAISDGTACDTSATSRYSAQARGYKVLKRSDDTWSERYAVNTNSDGFVDVELGYSGPKNEPYVLTRID